MKIKKAELLNALKSDLKSASLLKDYQDTCILKWNREYSGEPYGNEQVGKSAIVSRDIKKQSEWQHATIVDPFVSTSDVIKCIPVTWEDEAAAKQNELLLNAQFTRKFDRFNFISKAVKVLDREGTVVIQTGWDYEDKEVVNTVDTVKVDEYGQEVVVQEEVTETVVTKNQPTAKVCRNQDIYIDPTCQDDLDSAQFVIYRYESDLSSLKTDGRYKNLDKLSKVGREDYDYVNEDDTEFRFSDEARKKLVVYEYWGNYDVDESGIAKAIVCVWVNDVIIRLQGNPYPDGKPPFIVVPFNSIPFKIHGEANAELIGDNQKVKTAVIRGVIDNMAQSNNGQVATRKGALDPLNRKKFLAGKNFEYNGSTTDFWQGGYNAIPSSAFDMIGLMNNEIESITGTKSFSGGITGNSLGAMIDIDADIPMISGGFKKNGDLVAGDEIVGSDGNGTSVIVAHDAREPKIAYDMSFSNGAVIKAGGEHLWTVKVNGRLRKSEVEYKKWHTVDTDTIMEYVAKFSDRRNISIVIPRIGRVNNTGCVSVDIDPYCLGFWLGDGNSHRASITTEDVEVAQSFIDAGYPISKTKHQTPDSKGVTYDISSNEGNSRNSDTGMFEGNASTFHGQLRSLGLLKRYTGDEKFIPDEYFSAPYNVKLELVRGLMDSDGYSHSGAFNIFCQAEGKLKDDFMRLIFSMGVVPRISKFTTVAELNIRKERSKSGLSIVSRKAMYEIGFTLLDNPFRLSRKASKYKEPTRLKTVKLVGMEVVAKVMMRCLTVDSKDSLYAVGKEMTLTHNTATGARGALDATAVRRMNIVRNVAENLIKPLMRKWMSYNSEFLEDEEVVRVTNEEFVPIKRDDLDGSIDIDITISTAEDNAAKSQELSFLLQTLGPSEDPTIRRTIMSDIMELMRMPEQAKRMREFEPKPDPMQEKLKELEIERLSLENKLLEARVNNFDADAEENRADVVLKQNKAELEAAKVRKLNSESDMSDLKFIKEDEGYAHLERVELADINAAIKAEEEATKHRYNLEQMHAQIMSGDKQIGVIQ